MFLILIQIESFVFNEENEDEEDDDDEEEEDFNSTTTSTATTNNTNTNDLMATIDDDTRIKLEAILANAGKEKKSLNI